MQRHCHAKAEMMCDPDPLGSGACRAVLNDSYQTRVLLTHPPHIVAVACIVLVRPLAAPG